MTHLTHLTFLALLTSLAAAPASPPRRSIPRPLPSHPGNIFVAGEEVAVPIPATWGAGWQLVDYDGNVAARGPVQEGRARLGQLAVGYYDLASNSQGVSNRITLGVLRPLGAPTPKTSPIGIDVAMAWFFPKEKMAEVANLCALAGLNRVRDRLSWGEMEPARGTLSDTNRYDWSADAQSAAGLQILQVNHHSPNWANPNGKRFPVDLRDTYNFHREMARRWRGRVLAFEPWNEADIPMFGGHTGSEMASLQKAAYLGLKAGDPDIVACQNVFAVHRAETLRDFNENQAWPYFDTFNLHHYETFDRYPRLYADFRAVSGGRPLWVTECSVPVQWQGDEHLKEPSPGDLRIQSERVPKTYALAIHQGARAVFYFMLPHYVEGQTQFGVLRPDLTPRPAYLAVAAAGRLLADANPLGRVKLENETIRAFLFDARPDGKRSNVLVIWSDRETTFSVPQRVLAAFDHLGRPVAGSGRDFKLARAPLYLFLPKSTRFPLAPPPRAAPALSGKPWALVLQVLPPEEKIDFKKSAFRFDPGQTNAVPIFLYNFGPKKAQGRFEVSVLPNPGPDLLQVVHAPGQTEIGPGERQELALAFDCSTTAFPSDLTVRLVGDFGPAGKPVLSFRLLVEKK